MDKYKKEFMIDAINEANYNAKHNFKHGGPFGCVIVKDNKIIAKAHNTVLKTNDPTAHAEVNAIRIASKKLKTFNLEGCILYTSCEPCPMCLSAIIWSNIKDVYFANTKSDADKIGFRDDKIYDFIKGKNNLINLYHVSENDANVAFDLYLKNNFDNKY